MCRIIHPIAGDAMSPTADVREKPVFNVILDWHVIPTRRSWLVYDGGELIRDVEFAREEDAIAFATEKAAQSNAAEPDPSKHRQVVVSSRDMYRSVTENGITRLLPLPGYKPRDMKGRVWMAPDFDAPLDFCEADE